jgi:hypothetical protein
MAISAPTYFVLSIVGGFGCTGLVFGMVRSTLTWADQYCKYQFRRSDSNETASRRECTDPQTRHIQDVLEAADQSDTSHVETNLTLTPMKLS